MIKCMKNSLACVWQTYLMEEEHIVTLFLTEGYIFLKTRINLFPNHIHEEAKNKIK